MNVQESFSRVRIQEANVDLDEHEEQDLKRVLRASLEQSVKILDEQNMNDEDFLRSVVDTAVGLAVETYVAGRCYEEQFNSSETFPIDLPKEVLGDFIQFLYTRRVA